MSTKILASLSFSALVIGVPQVQPHGININGVPTIPQYVIPSVGPLTIAVDATNVTVTRANASQPTSVNILLITWHSIQGTITIPPPFTAPVILDQAGSASTAGGWTDDGTNVRLTTVTDTVSIGAATPLAGEKVRIVGDELLEGNLLPNEGVANTFLGRFAGGALTVGGNNSLYGVNAGSSLTTGSDNTAIGSNTLTVSAAGFSNTAVGAAALSSNTTGFNNTAVGTIAMSSNTTGFSNTAVGLNALSANTTSTNVTALGTSALSANVTGDRNTAVGSDCANANTTGADNTACGFGALQTLTTGSFNTALGRGANVSAAAATGRIAIGISSAGLAASATIDDGLFFHTSVATVAAGTAVLYDAATGQMGPMVSSRRFKENIARLETDSEKIFQLRPVSYDLKATGERQFGYIAEEVQEVIPQLVPKDAEGFALSVNYDRLVVLLIEEVRRLRARVDRIEAK